MKIENQNPFCDVIYTEILWVSFWQGFSKQKQKKMNSKDSYEI